MSLHKATEIIKKIFIGASIGIGSIILLVIIFRIGIFFKNIIFPPKITPPNQAYELLPFLQFPENEITTEFSYTINTVSGELPTDFPDRLVIYPLVKKTPNLLNLDKARTKAQALGFVDTVGKTLPEASLGNGIYQWSESTGINRQLNLDIVTFDFSLSSTYLTSLTVLGAKILGNETGAIKTTQEFLENIELFPEDIDLKKTENPQKDVNYNTYPQLFDIQNGELIITTSLSNTKVIRVDLYQKDIEYELETGNTLSPKLSMKIPIFYPTPPYSLMNFLITAGPNKAEVAAADFMHREIEIPKDAPQVTYPIKTVTEAFEELKSGQVHIPSYLGTDTEILIDKVYLAYYIGDLNQEYLMPIIVFEGPNNFFAYVSAVRSESLN